MISGQKSFAKFPTCPTYLLTNKWNGTNIQVFKYENEKGEILISAKQRMSPFVSDGPNGNYLTATKEALNIKGSNWKLSDTTLPKQLSALVSYIFLVSLMYSFSNRTKFNQSLASCVEVKFLILYSMILSCLCNLSLPLLMTEKSLLSL
jgi:hypothetical protein